MFESIIKFVKLLCYGSWVSFAKNTIVRKYIAMELGCSYSTSVLSITTCGLQKPESMDLN